ncbi:MAG: hypothetical protein O7A98_01740 [Acidobacteria bacterium]|nr:hypothetical protein [Acidobacteriota bacterium]
MGDGGGGGGGGSPLMKSSALCQAVAGGAGFSSSLPKLPIIGQTMPAASVIGGMLSGRAEAGK